MPPLLKVLVLVLLAAAGGAAEGAAPPRLGVCVTGQLRRLELWSKLQHLVAANADRFEVDLLFVLDPGPGGPQQYDRRHVARVLGLDILNATLQHCPRCRVAVDMNLQPRSPALVKPYVGDMSRLNATGGAVDAMLRRSATHVRMFNSWSRCFRGFSHDPYVHYDAFLRIRDDLFVARPMVITEDMWKGVVSVKDNCGWPGYNDKLAVLDARFGYQYFVSPLNNLYLNYEEMRNQAYLISPESILRASLNFDRVPVQILSAEQVPIIPTQRRHESNSEAASQSYCFVRTPRKPGSATDCVADTLHPLLSKHWCARENNSLQDTIEFWQERFNASAQPISPA